ncbi:hypothetical protein O0550_23860 [Brevibacillus halotolerans]|uniref:hypothetical protein n=1 Tax=Brevibacillus TaxID=55080 RepID=UPI00215D4596|nr:MULTISPECIES: hypothetical protein [Brevibacillus]MCR8966181.1 hypothetical protein [Brevibacillus laterosporus]MCZ0838338.1 hypothetical protein [Brevibacillus halotolerans]
MKKSLVSLSTFAVLTVALAVPTFAATDVNTVKETNSQVLLIKPAVDAVKGGPPVRLYSDSKNVFYTSETRGYHVYSRGEAPNLTWYLQVDPDAPNTGWITERYPNGVKREHKVNAY